MSDRFEFVYWEDFRKEICFVVGSFLPFDSELARLDTVLDPVVSHGCSL
jgi:hypothetical protein